MSSMALTIHILSFTHTCVVSSDIRTGVARLRASRAPPYIVSFILRFSFRFARALTVNEEQIGW